MQSQTYFDTVMTSPSQVPDNAAASSTLEADSAASNIAAEICT